MPRIVVEQRLQQRRCLDTDRADLVSRATPFKAKDHVVGLDHRSSAARRFAQYPPDAVAIDRVAQDFLPDDVAHAAGRRLGWRGDELQPRAVVASAGAKYRFERANPAEPVTTSAANLRTGRGRRDCCCDQGASRARPLARRAESTLRPPTVFIRARKPWVRLRLTTEG
jgi:hypothetical protein